MPVGFLYNALSDGIGARRRKQRDNRGAEALDAMIRRIQEAGGGPQLSAAQQAAQSRQMDPLLQLLNGQQQAPQQSPLPQPGPGVSPQMQQTIAEAQALQTAGGGQSGLDHLLSRTDPQYAAELERTRLANQAAQNQAQQYGRGRTALDTLIEETTAPDNSLPPALQGERGGALLELLGGQGAAEAVLQGNSQSPPFEGTGIENQMLNMWLQNKDVPGWKDSEQGRLVQQRLQRDVTTVTPQGTFIRPGYNLDGQQMPQSAAPGGQGPDGTLYRKTPTEGELRDTYVAGGLFAREQELQTLLNTPTFNPADAKHMTGRIPGIGNFTVSPEWQQYRTAADDWATKQVFLTSGATAREEEKTAAFQNFFPQPGDDIDTQVAKTKRRLQANIDAYNKALTSGRVQSDEATSAIASLQTQLNQLNQETRSDDDILKQYGVN